MLLLILLFSGCASRPHLLQIESSEPSRNQDQAKILSIAKELIGTKYRFGGTDPTTGFDCSGYVAYVYREAVGIDLPRQTRDQIEMGMHVSDPLKVGDMVYFKISAPNAWHTGIYIGHGKFIHAPRTAGAVNIQEMTLPYWKKRFVGARRLL
jgi:cell wall-associated NlpC family hydrolase